MWCLCVCICVYQQAYKVYRWRCQFTRILFSLRQKRAESWLRVAHTGGTQKDVRKRRKRTRQRQRKRNVIQIRRDPPRMVGNALRFYWSEIEKDVDRSRGSRRKSDWSCYPREKEKRLELPVMQILRRGVSSAFQYSWFTRYMQARIVFSGRAVLSNADRISNTAPALVPASVSRGSGSRC